MSLTSTIFVTQIGETPKISKTHKCSCHSQQEFQFVGPLAPIQKYLTFFHNTAVLCSLVTSCVLCEVSGHCHKLSGWEHKSDPIQRGCKNFHRFKRILLLHTTALHILIKTHRQTAWQTKFLNKQAPPSIGVPSFEKNSTIRLERWSNWMFQFVYRDTFVQRYSHENLHRNPNFASIVLNMRGSLKLFSWPLLGTDGNLHSFPLEL